MKKLLLLGALVCAGQMYGMEPLYPQKSSKGRGQDYMAMLPKEIKQYLMVVLTQSSTIEQAVNTIRSLTRTSKEFNAMLSNPITLRSLIRVLAQKFNAPSGYVAQQLNTLGSQNYIQLSEQLLIFLSKQEFDTAEELLDAGADIDFQPADTYPMFCMSMTTMFLLNQLNQILDKLENVLDLQKEPSSKAIKQEIWGIQGEIAVLISNVRAVAKKNKNIFKNDEEFNEFIDKVNLPANEKNLLDGFAIIKPKQFVYNKGITAFYTIEDTDDRCVIGANLSPIMYAIVNNQPNLLKWLIEHKANLDLYMGAGNTALMVAIYSNQKEMIELLVKNGANVNQKNILKSNEEIRKKVEKSGPLSLLSIDMEQAHEPYASLNEETLTAIMRRALVRYQETPLIHLLMSEQFSDQELYDLFKLLLDNGANPNLADSNGDTPLIYLITMHGTEIAKIMELLLAYGADPSIKNDDNKTALDYARSEENADDPEQEEKIELLENAMRKQQKK